MKKRAYSVIEVLIAMAIFLFGIFPIIGFTFTSLRGERIAGSKEEAARLTTTVVDYIKSRGYDDIKDIVDPDGDNVGSFSGTYKLKSDSTAFIIDTAVGDDFEGVFFPGVNTATDGNIFVLNSRGMRLDDGKAGFRVYMSLVDVGLYKWTDSDGDGVETTNEWIAEGNYENPVTGNNGNTIFGTGGINTNETQGSGSLSRDKFILGKVVFEYTQNTDGVFDKNVEMQFVISPIEEWR